MAIESYRGTYNVPMTSTEGNAAGAIGQFLTGIGKLSEGSQERKKKSDIVAFEEGLKMRQQLENEQRNEVLNKYQGEMTNKLLSDMEQTKFEAEDTKNVATIGKSYSPKTEHGQKIWNSKYGEKPITQPIVGEGGKPYLATVDASGNITRTSSEIYQPPKDTSSNAYEEYKNNIKLNNSYNVFKGGYTPVSGEKIDWNDNNVTKASMALIKQFNGDQDKIDSYLSSRGGLKNYATSLASSQGEKVTEPAKVDDADMAIGSTFKSDIGGTVQLVGKREGPDGKLENIYKRTEPTVTYNEIKADKNITDSIEKANTNWGRNEFNGDKVIKFLAEAGASKKAIEEFLSSKQKINSTILQSIFGSNDDFIKDIGFSKEDSTDSVLIVLANLLNDGNLSFDKKSTPSKDGLYQLDISNSAFKTLKDAKEHYKKYGTTLVNEYTNPYNTETPEGY